MGDYNMMMKRDRIHFPGKSYGAVFADTHGNTKEMKNVFENENYEFDYMIHLGDGVLDGAEVAGDHGFRYFGIGGNWDRHTAYPGKRILTVNKFSFLMIHGEFNEIPYYECEERERQIEILYDMAHEYSAQAVLFGHTHHVELFRKKGVIFCNPGHQHLGATAPVSYAKIIVADKTFSLSIMRQAEKSWDLEYKLHYETDLKKKNKTDKTLFYRGKGRYGTV